MRSDLESNRGRGLILTGSKLGTFRKQLTGDIQLSKDSTNNLLDANGADRTVTLPNVDAGVFMVISNTGAANNLILKNPDASQILTLTPGDSTWLVGNANKWYAVAGVNDVFGPSGPNHKVGLVPDPGAVPGTTRVLKEDGTWGTFAAVANDSYAHITNGVVSTTASGLDTFKIRSSTGKIGITVQENDVTHGDNADFTVLEAAVDHNALLNFVANKHIDHSAVSISAGEGLSGGGDLTVARTLALAFAGLVAATPVLGDTLAFYDLSATAHRKMLISELNAVLAHDSLAGFVANKHIDHSLVFMIAGAGISGGGDITATRTFSLDINSLTAQATMGANDYLAFYDVGGADHNKLTLTQLAASLTGIGFGGGGGGGTPGGANTQIQFNDVGAFGGDVDFTWNKTTNTLGFGLGGTLITLGGTERLRIESGGFTTFGGFASTDTGGFSRVQVVGDGSTENGLGFVSIGNNTDANGIVLAKTRGLTPTSHVIVQNGDTLGAIVARGSDGVAYQRGPGILFEVDAAPAANSMPSRLSFWTVPTGSVVRSERMRIDSAGHVIIGGVASQAVPNQNALQIHGTTFDTAGATFARWANTATSVASLNLLKSRGATVGTHGAILAGDNAARISAYFDDGTSYLEAARIDFDVDGTPGLNDIPSAIKLYTVADGTTSIVERLRIDNAGHVVIGGAAQVLGNGGGGTPQFQVNSTSLGGSWVGYSRWANNTQPVFMTFSRSRGAAIGTHAISSSGDDIAYVGFAGSDGAAFQESAVIKGSVDGAPALGSVPGRLTFWTAAVGSGSATERMRVANNGAITMSGTTGALAAPAIAGGGIANLTVVGEATRYSYAEVTAGNQQFGGGIVFNKTRGANPVTHGVVASEDFVGGMDFAASDGTNFEYAAYIQAYVDGAPGANIMPGRIVFGTTPSGSATPVERMRIDNAGHVIVNGGAAETTFASGFTPSLQVLGTGIADSMIGIARYGNTGNQTRISMAKSRGASKLVHGVLAANDIIGQFLFEGSDGTTMREAAKIAGEVDGAPGANNMPGRLLFYTTSTGAGVATERMRLDHTGKVTIGGFAPFVGGYGAQQILQIAEAVSGNGNAQFAGFQNNAQAPFVSFVKSRGTTIGAHVSVASGDGVGAVVFVASDGTSFVPAASIFAYVDGAPGLNDMPGRLVFKTTLDGASSETERLRIDNAGIHIIQDTATATGAIATYAGNLTPRLQIHSTSIESLAVTRWNAGGNGPKMFLAHSGAGVGAYGTLGIGSMVGEFVFAYPGLGGSTFNMSSVIRAIVDFDSVGTIDTPSALTFMTQTPNGALNERFRIDANGRMTNRGGSLTTTLFGSTPGLSLDMTKGPLSLQKFSADSGGPWITADKSRNATFGSHTVVNDNDDLLGIYASGSTGTTFTNAATILIRVDGTPPGAGVPGRIMFMTTLSGNSSPSERVRIDNAGNSWLMSAPATAVPPTNAVANLNETAALFNHEALGGI